MNPKPFVGLALGLALAAWVSGPIQARGADLDKDPHLLAWWAFETASEQRLLDASGHDHHAVLKAGTGAPLAAGHLGQALATEDSPDGITVPGFKGVGGTGPRTVAAWIKTGQAQGEIVSWGEREPGRMWSLCFIRGRCGVNPQGGYLYMNAAIHDNAWHYVAVVVQEASPPNLHDDVRLYLDGTLAEIHDIGLLDLWPIDTGADQDVTMGRRFKGMIDELRIYDRALSEEEIKTLFSQKGNAS